MTLKPELTDGEMLDFLSKNFADVGFRDGMFGVLVWGYHGGVYCVVASAHNLSLRAAIQACADRVKVIEARKAAA
jgi:hypothetical protein